MGRSTHHLRRLSAEECLINISTVEVPLPLEGGEYLGEDEGWKEVDSYCNGKQDDGVIGYNIIALIIVASQ
jgi:hypothetical protein